MAGAKTAIGGAILHGPLAKAIGRNLTLRGTGGLLLSQLYARAWTESPYPDRVVRATEGALFRVDTNSFLEWQIYAFGGLQPAVTRMICDLLRPGDVAIDVGANIGYQAVAMAKVVGPTGQVLAVEPVEALRGRLQENLTLNGIREVEMVGVAVGDKPGLLRLFPGRPDSPNKAQVSAIPHSHLDIGSGSEVEATTVDTLVADRGYHSVRLIKIDVEGYEPETLVGCQQVLRDFAPYVVFEFTPSFLRVTPQEAWDWIRRSFSVAEGGYEFYAIADRGAITPVGDSPPRSTCDVLAAPRRLGRFPAQ